MLDKGVILSAMKSETEIVERIRRRAEFLKPFMDQVEEEREMWRQRFSGTTWAEEEIAARHRAYHPLVNFQYIGSNHHRRGMPKKGNT